MAKTYAGITSYRSKKTKQLVYYGSLRDSTRQPRKVRLQATTASSAYAELQDLKDQASSEREKIVPKPLFAKLKKLTLVQVLEKYEDWRIENGSSKKDAVGTTRRLSKHCKPILKYTLPQIDLHDLKRIKATMVDAGLAPKTINNIFVMLRACINRAMAEGWVRLLENPVNMDKILFIKQEHKVKPILTAEEVRVLLEAVQGEGMLELFTVLLYRTGGRPAAVLKLKVNSIDFANSRVLIGALKRGYDYSVTVSAETMELIRWHIKEYDIKENQYLFHSTVNKKTPHKHLTYTPLQTRLTALMPRGLSPYALRRTAGTFVYQRFGLVVSSKFLAHTSVVTTIQYLQVQADMDVVFEAL